MAKPGAPSRGDRRQFPLRPPRQHYDTFKAHADELGIPLGSYVLLRLSEAEGLPIPDFVRRHLDKARARRQINGQGDLLAAS